jgi:DNA-directed RNA polymerase specialized sigma subunit
MQKNQDIQNVFDILDRDKSILNNVELVNIIAKRYGFLESSKYEDLIQHH